MKSQLYCGWDCFQKSLVKPARYCQECNQLLTKKWNLKFCGRSCSTIYNNKNRKIGTRRSKLEKFIEEQLSKKFNQDDVLFNNKTIIGRELDIYFPKLKLAIEINGPFHYRPIYGEEKFNRIKELDEQKRVLCEQKNIKLISIDTQNQLQFSEKSSIMYIDEILRRVDERLKSTVY
jgi:very-short-patch-repair endonuclease